MNYHQAARLMINKHGRNARKLAMQRAAELRAKDELATAAMWVKVSNEVAAQQAASEGAMRYLDQNLKLSVLAATGFYKKAST